MAPFSDLPLEVIEEVINALQEDKDALKACSQTCLSLLPLCRKHIFRSIELTHRSWKCPRPQHAITLFGRLMDSNPEIAKYVRNLKYHIEILDYDKHVPQILGRLRHVQSVQLLGIGVHLSWNTLSSPFRESLLNIIQLHSVKSLHIACFKNFPIEIFIPCVNLIDLTITQHFGAVVEKYESEFDGIMIQLQSFAFGVCGGQYAKSLLGARRSNRLPVFDFSNLRKLNVYVENHSDLAVTHAFIEATGKLKTLTYTVVELNDGFAGLASHMNTNSLSTLRQLSFDLEINDDIQDPLCGLCDELTAFAGSNVIEEISLEVMVQTDCRCKTGDEWGRLDVVLAKGFPNLRQVSLCIVIAVYSSSGMVLQEKLNKLPEEQFPWFFNSKMVTFEFSTTVDSD